MTAYSKAEKLRAKKVKKARMEAMFGIQPVQSEKPKKRGKARQTEINRATQAETLSVRARLAGLPDTEEGRTIATSPWFECDAGRAIFFSNRGEECEIRRLWGVVYDWRKHEARFLAQVLNTSMYPGRDSVPHIPDRAEKREDAEYNPHSDPRTEDERADAAKRAWQAFCKDAKILSETELRICFRGVWDREPNFIQRNPGTRPRLTYEGAVFVAAVQKLADHISA